VEHEHGFGIVGTANLNGVGLHGIGETRRVGGEALRIPVLDAYRTPATPTAPMIIPASSEPECNCSRLAATGPLVDFFGFGFSVVISRSHLEGLTLSQ